MSKYEFILFDFDGTIVDTGEGILKSIEYALTSLNYPVNSKDELKKFIGPPLVISFREFCHFNEEQIEKAVSLYRERYNKKGLYEISKYKDLENLLIKLKDENKKIILATSKPEDFAIAILKNVDLYKYFDFIAGSTLDGKRNNKTKVIDYAIKNMNITDISKAIMIGDRKFDIEGANNFNMDSIGVLYGYGSYNELSKAGATYIKRTPMDIYEILK